VKFKDEQCERNAEHAIAECLKPFRSSRHDYFSAIAEPQPMEIASGFSILQWAHLTFLGSGFRLLILIVFPIAGQDWD
jgi:hypothetical protein